MKKLNCIYRYIAPIICIAVISAVLIPDILYGETVEYRCWSIEENITPGERTNYYKRILAACIKRDYKMINGTKIKHYDRVSCGGRISANESYDLMECLDAVIESKKCKGVHILEKENDFIYSRMRCKR